MKHYLALDIGTTNWKVAVFTVDGQLEGIQRCPTKTHINSEGHSYYDPNELWNSFKILIKQVVSETTGDIAAISVASVGEAVVPVDRDGNALDNIVTWYDCRAAKEAEVIKKTFGSEKIYSISGLDINPIFSLPKIMHVMRNNGVVAEKTYKWLQIADYILMKLSGEFATDYTLASRTLAFDILKNNWSDEILKGVGLSSDVFPRVMQSGTVIGKVKKTLCSEFGFTNDPKVVLGGHDHPCGTVVTGAVRGGKVHDSSGTAEAFILISEKSQKPNLVFQGQRTCRWLEKDRYLTVGGIVSSGVSFDWAYRLFANPSKKSSYDEVLSELKEIKAIESGLFFYPNLRGAGAPWWDSTQRGSFIGLRDSMDNRHFLRATIEGLCMQARVLLEMHEAINNRIIDRICVVGGSSKNIFWQQLKADITQREVELCHESEATALGAAMLAAIGDGMYSSIEEVSEEFLANNGVLEPDYSKRLVYEELYEIYKNGYNALEKINHSIEFAVNK